MTIDKLQVRLAEVRAQINVLANEKSDLEQQIAAIKCPFSVGDIIEFGWARNRRKAKVSGIACRYGHWMLLAQNVKKDGSLGADVDIEPIHKPVKVSA
ncbi:hypothetical protein CIW54_07610 [Paraburkholderia sp. T12-10]|nr:hypothetical protein CIW54_07610 [Paraburkholderia sp. T12-10]